MSAVSGSTEDADPLAYLDFDVEVPTDFIDVTKLEDAELGDYYARITNSLKEIGEMHTPPALRSERAKDLHSRMIAARIETLRRRHDPAT